MQRNVVTTAKRQLLDLSANYTLRSMISSLTPPPAHKHCESQENGSRCLDKVVLVQGSGVADEYLTM